MGSRLAPLPSVAQRCSIEWLPHLFALTGYAVLPDFEAWSTMQSVVALFYQKRFEFGVSMRCGSIRAGAPNPVVKIGVAYRSLGTLRMRRGTKEDTDTGSLRLFVEYVSHKQGHHRYDNSALCAFHAHSTKVIKLGGKSVSMPPEYFRHNQCVRIRATLSLWAVKRLHCASRTR